MTKTATLALLTFLTAATSWAQTPDSAQTAVAVNHSSSEKVRDNPAAQYVLLKTVVGKTIGDVKIVISGVNASGFSGLGLGANSTTIRGLAIGGFLDGITTGSTTLALFETKRPQAATGVRA